MADNKLQIACPNCSTIYKVDSSLLNGGRKAMKCAVCSDTFVVESRRTDEPVAETEIETPAREETVFDSVEDDSSVDYDPEETAWDTDPENDPIFGERKEEEAEDLEEALEDYDSIDIDDLSFGDDDIEDLNDLDEDETDETGKTVEEIDQIDVEEDGPVPEPQPSFSSEKIDASDDSFTQDGRRAEDVENQFHSSREEADSPFEDDDHDEELDESEDEVLETPEPQEEAKISHSPLASLLAAEQEKSALPFDNDKSSRKKKRSSFVKNEKVLPPENLEASSGAIYYILIIIIGLCGLATNFVNLAEWRFDPVWSGSMIFIGILGFFLQNLSGIYIAGFFSIFYSFSLFAGAHKQINMGQFSGVLHLAVIFVLAFILSMTYALLIGRKSGHFILKESVFQSILAFILGLAAILTAYWAHINSDSIAPLGKWLIMKWPISSYVWYKTVSLDMIFQAAAAAGAIAVGISAHRVRNRLLILAKLAIVFGVVIILLLFAPNLIGPLTFDFPV